MANRYQRKDRAEMEIDRKKKKIRAAQIVGQEIRTGKSVPKTLSQSQDIASYIAEVSGGPVRRDMMGNIVKSRRK